MSAERWVCDWKPDDLNPIEDGCPYCAGRTCARFDGLGCTHGREERHGYYEACGYSDPFGGPCVLPQGHAHDHDDGTGRP